MRCTCLLVFSLFHITHGLASAQLDADATLYLVGGSTRTAILLYCTDSTLYADFSMQSWERETVPPLDAVYWFSPEDVDSVYCHGTEYSALPSIVGGIFGAFLGMLPGVLVGGGLGALVASDDDDGVALGFGIAGGIGGMITGAVIGSSRDASDDLPPQMCHPRNGLFPAALSVRCLYKERLPRFLHVVRAYTEQ
ncbi:MAG: hypothetical protein M5R41_11540 [Bacteroidia bacterium]|nr:hypothetical protein [Bacteroidia bacterium]